MVVTHEEDRTFVRNVLHIQDADSVTAEHKAEKRAEHGLRQVVNRPDKHTDRNNSKADKVVLRTNIRKAHQHRKHE